MNIFLDRKILAIDNSSATVHLGRIGIKIVGQVVRLFSGNGTSYGS